MCGGDSGRKVYDVVDVIMKSMIRMTTEVMYDTNYPRIVKLPSYLCHA